MRLLFWVLFWSLAAGLISWDRFLSKTIVAGEERELRTRRWSRSQSNLRQLGTFIQIYANAHYGAYPPDMNTLKREATDFDQDILDCPRPGYRYVFRFPKRAPSRLEVVAWEEGSGDGMNIGILLADGSVLSVPGDIASDMCARLEATDAEKRSYGY
jgi:hypothetical protein